VIENNDPSITQQLQ